MARRSYTAEFKREAVRLAAQPVLLHRATSIDLAGEPHVPPARRIALGIPRVARAQAERAGDRNRQAALPRNTAHRTSEPRTADEAPTSGRKRRASGTAR